MVNEHAPLLVDNPPMANDKGDDKGDDNDAPPRVVVPPAFYRDDEPPEPPDGDPHWQEFPLFDYMKGNRLVVAFVVGAVLFATFAHLAIVFFI